MTKARSLAGLGSVSDTPLMFRNRIINGDFRVDQKSLGTLVAGVDGNYGTDRWIAIATQSNKFNMQQNLNSITPPPGFVNYLGISSASAMSVASSDYVSVRQWIEGSNVADLKFGLASASQVTISFWVQSSLTGQFGGNLINWNASRSIPFTYTINSANTWEQKFVTISGDVTGTWYTNSSRGIGLDFNLAVGTALQSANNVWTGSTGYGPTGAVNLLATNAATLYIAGVQLEKGPVATAFEARPLGVELALCQRYYIDLRPGSGTTQYPAVLQSGAGGSGFMAYVVFPVKMRTVPAAVFPSSMTGLLLNWPFPGSTAITSLAGSPYTSELTGCVQGIQSSAFGSAGYAMGLQISSTAGVFGFSAEL
jgi:hypothetical protein